MSKVVRSVKNVTKGYTHAQVKVRNATSNDPWGPVGSDMAEIAQLTFADAATFYEIMDILDKRLNDKGKNWRHVLKSLKVLDYCLHEGSELVVTWARKNIYIIKTLREFQHIDDDGKDVGQNIRVSAKELTALILDEERLRAERRDRKSWKSRVTGIDDVGNSGDIAPPRRRENRERTEDEDLEYKLALEASKNEAAEDAKRRARASNDGDDDDLAKAIKLSQEEEALRQRELEQANANSLFDDTPTPQASQPTGWNQGYQQQPTVDWFGNVIDPQQQLNTGFGPQNTGFQNGYGGYPGFNAGAVQPQMTSFNVNNPYNQQSNGFGQQNPQLQQQQQLQQQPPPQQESLSPGTNNPWATASQPLDGLKAAATGSNNPFATSLNRPHSAQAFSSPSLSTLQEQKAQTPLNPILNYQSSQPVDQSFQQQQQQLLLQQQQLQQQQQQRQQQSLQDLRNSKKPMDPNAARLNELLATGEGQDSFGNVGETRIPAQHTAPGVFVNSAGAGSSRLTQNATGANPFLNNQFTGAPPAGGGFGQGGRIMPAQTGPVGGFGASGYGGGANPFSKGPGQQQQGASNLIDL